MWPDLERATHAIMPQPHKRANHAMKVPSFATAIKSLNLLEHILQKR